jgi:hypothetical protein
MNSNANSHVRGTELAHQSPVPLFFFERSFDMKLKVICAWCTKTIEVKELDGESSESAVSHGICEPCKDEALEEIRNEEAQNE